MLYRRAKRKAAIIEEHWQSAADAVNEAAAAIGDQTGHQADSVREILRAAQEALEVEEPEEALHIASSIPEHLESLGSSEEAAAKSLSDAEHAVAAAEDDIRIATKGRLEQARNAMDSGDADLAKGLADSVLRDVRSTSDALHLLHRVRGAANIPQNAVRQALREIRIARIHGTAGLLEPALGGNSNVVLGCGHGMFGVCLLYTSPSPRDKRQSRMPSSA